MLPNGETRAQGDIPRFASNVLLDKQRILSDIYINEKLDALCLCETHNTPYAPHTPQ